MINAFQLRDVENHGKDLTFMLSALSVWKEKPSMTRSRRNVAEEPLLARRLRGVGWARCNINRMWERECLSSDTLYPCCPSVSFDIGNHPLHYCTSITAPSSHRLPIWLEGITTWFPIWNTSLYFVLRHVNALTLLSSPDSFHVAEKSNTTTDFSFDNFCCLTSNIISVSNHFAHIHIAVSFKKILLAIIFF